MRLLIEMRYLEPMATAVYYMPVAHQAGTEAI